MKVFYIGDNTTNSNWGRGASVALCQLLSDKLEISGRITGDLFVLSNPKIGYVNTFMPPKYYWLFLRILMNRKKRRIFSWYIKLEKLFGAKDFIAEDPAESIDNLLSHKNRYPDLSKIYDQASEADLLLIDGNGDIIFTTPPRREALFLLAMIELGIRLHKKVFLVNTMISDCPVTGRNVQTLAAARALLSKCRAVAVRDPQSLEYVEKEMPEVNVSYIPDSLFSWYPLYDDPGGKPPLNGDFLIPFPEKTEYLGKLDFSKPYICIGGGASAASQPNEARRCYERLIDAIQKLGFPVYLTENDGCDSFLKEIARAKGIGIVPVETPVLLGGAVLASARLFISGRYHPSIFASLGGTPCIFLGSHAHKMASLQRVLEYESCREFPAFPRDVDVGQILSLAKDYLDQGDSLREKIKKVAGKRCEEARGIVKFIYEHL